MTATSCWQRGSGGRGEPVTAAAGSNQSSIRIQTHHSTATGTNARASTARLWICSGFTVHLVESPISRITAMYLENSIMNPNQSMKLMY